MIDIVLFLWDFLIVPGRIYVLDEEQTANTPGFVWKQYSFQWETFSKVRQGNPTLN